MAAAAAGAIAAMTTVPMEMMPVFEQQTIKLNMQIEEQQARNNRLDDEILKVKRKLAKERESRLNLGSPRSHLRGIGANDIFAAMGRYNQKRIRILEVDRDRAIKFHDRIKAGNEDTRREIDELRKAMVVARKQWKKISLQLQDVKAKMAKALQDANETMELHQEIKELKEELKEEDAQEKAEFERECAALSAYIEERLERLAFLEDTTVDHDVLVGNLTKDDEARIKQEVSTLKRKLDAERAKDLQDQAKFNTYQTAFDKLKRATGIADLQKMVNNFIETEDRNFGMFRYIQHVNKEVRRLQKSVDSTQKEIAAYKAKHSSVIESKEKMVVKLRRVAAELRDDIAMYAAKLESLSKQREFLFKAVERTFRNSGCASLASEDGGGLADSRAATQPIGRREDGDDSPTSRPRTAIPSHVKDRPTSAGSVRSATYEVQSLMTAEVTETNVERFMGIIEQHCIELCARARRQGLIDVSEDSEGSDAEREDGSGQGKDKADSSDTRSDAKAASRNMVKGPDVPFQSNTFHVVLPDINEGHDTVDLAATLPNPITNAMEASMKTLREEQGNALDDDALARLLPIDAAKRDNGRHQRARSAPQMPGSDDVGIVTTSSIIAEIAKQFQGPDGLAVSQFIKKGPATKPAEENKKGRSGLRRSKKRSALSQTIGGSGGGSSETAGNIWASSTAPAGLDGGQASPKTRNSGSGAGGTGRRKGRRSRRSASSRTSKRRSNSGQVRFG